jgi:mono/diheme cytochrome c family protein
LSLEELRLLSRYFKITRPETEKAIERGPHGDLQVIERREWWSDPQRIERGKSLFADYCMGCHHPEYEAFAPAYRNIARQRDIRAIVGQIKFPYTSSRILGYTQQTMPKFDLTDEEIRNLGAYVYHFRTEGK